MMYRNNISTVDGMLSEATEVQMVKRSCHVISSEMEIDLFKRREAKLLEDELCMPFTVMYIISHSVSR